MQTNRITEEPSDSARIVLPGLHHRMSPAELVILNWTRFSENLKSLSMDQILKLLETAPIDLAQYIHFLSGGGL